MKKLILLLSLSSLSGLAYAEFRKSDDGIEFAIWKCVKNNKVFYSDAERDAYIKQASVSSDTLTTADFQDVSVPQDAQDEVLTAGGVMTPVLTDDLSKKVADLEARVEALEKK